MGDFAKSLASVLREEGGYVNNPHDPGGATMRGVTQRVYDAFRRNVGLPILWVKKITMGEVEEIYRSQYWEKIWGDKVPDGVDLMLLDEAVNSGVARAVKDLQGEIGVHEDGIFGHLTLEALLAQSDMRLLIKRLANRRLGFLRRLATWRFFSKGWSARCQRVQAEALERVSG